MSIKNHNLVKIRSLYYMRCRQAIGQHWITAGQLVDALDHNRDSMYVLLARWVKWKLIDRNMEVLNPHSYALGKQGSRYLINLRRWYPQREIVFTSVLESVELTFCWLQKSNGQIIKAHIIKYPFQNAEDYAPITPDANGKLEYQGKSRLLIKKANCLEAILAIKEYNNLSYGKGLIDKLIEQRFIARN